MHSLLIASVALRFEKLMAYSREHERELGLGALVFFEDGADEHLDFLGCEYWTLGKIRESLRQLDEFDEGSFRWLMTAREQDSLPIIVFSAGNRPGTLDMTFHTLTHHQAA